MTEQQLRFALGVSTLILPPPGATISGAERALMAWVYLLETITAACRTFAVDEEIRILAVRC